MSTVLIEGKRGRFHVNPHDTLIGASLRTYGEFAEHEMMLLSHWARPGDTIVDIGANIGTHSVFFSQAVGPGGKVTAIEAQSEIFEILKLNLALNGCVNVTPMHAACGAVSGELSVPSIDYGRDGNFGAFSFRIDGIERLLPVSARAPSTPVPMVPLDAIDLAACHLMKIDAEGMEREVIDGAARTIERFRPVLYLENNNRDASRGVFERVSSLGYSAYWHVISYYRANNFARSADNIFAAALELNVLCLPTEKGVGCPLPVMTAADQWLPDDLDNGRYSLDELLLLSEMFGFDRQT